MGARETPHEQTISNISTSSNVTSSAASEESAIASPGLYLSLRLHLLLRPLSVRKCRLPVKLHMNKRPQIFPPTQTYRPRLVVQHVNATVPRSGRFQGATSIVVQGARTTCAAAL